MKRFSIAAFTLTVLLFCLNSCKKQIENSTTELSQEVKKETIKQAELAIAKDIITLVKTDDNFRAIAYKECLQQKFGDYYVRLNDLVNACKKSTALSSEVTERLLANQEKIQKFDNRNVTIFIPSMEKHPEKAYYSKYKTGIGARVEQYTEPVAVIAEEYSSPTETCPGYIVNLAGTLTFYQAIDESYAWENDVWVIGQEENCSEENMVPNPADTGTIDYSYLQSKTWGGAEYGGNVKVTDWRLVEPWILGKVEFRMTVYDSKGIQRADRKFGKWRRGHFDNKFFNFNHFIGNWTQTAFGDFTPEKWMEEDGGFSMTLNFGVTIKINDVVSITPFNVAIPIKNLDDDLGLSTIQFTDPISTIYYQSGIQFMRTN